MLLKSKLKTQRNPQESFATHILDPEYGLYIEGYFKERLCFEKKRVERSKRPLLMMLFDIETILKADEKRETIKTIQMVISSFTRETDLTGWYKDHSTIGVLFTESNGIDVSLVKQKIYGNLCSCLDIEQARKIKVSFQKLNGNHDGPNGDNSFNLMFYADAIAPPPKHSYFTLKRVIDILGSIIGFIIFSPLFLIIPILIKVSSKGPILFKQERVGLNGKRFAFFKFRSMKFDNNPDVHREFVTNLIKRQQLHKNGNGNGNGKNNGVYKIENDDRIFPLGQFLRKASLDELPQFMNVLKGEMSLVGPRPPIPYELESYDIWHKRRLLQVKPGITGLWQVSGRSTCTFDEMVRLDLNYIRRKSLWLDIKILLQTIWVVFSGRGAY